MTAAAERPAPGAPAAPDGVGPTEALAQQDSLHEEEALGKAVDSRLLRRLWRYVSPYRSQVAVTLLLVVPIFLFELAPAWIVKIGLDQVIAPSIGLTGTLGAAREGTLAPPAALHGLVHAPAWIPPLVWLGVLYLVAMLVSSGLQFWQTLVMAKTGQLAVRDLRSDVFGHLASLHIGFFDRMPVGRLVTRATNDVENIAEMFSAGIVALLTDLLKMLGFAIALFLVNPKLAGVTFLVVPFLAVAAIVFRLRIRDAFRAVRVRIARINAMLQETVTGMKVVQLFTREARNLRDFSELNASHRDAWIVSIRYDAALFAAVEVAQNLTVAMVIGYGTGLVEAGVIYVFIDWMRRFFMPLRDLSAKYSVMQSSMASCERIFQLLDTVPAVRDAAPRERPRALEPAPGAGRGAIALEGVWFAYNAADWVLKDVSFTVAPGEKVALVGATGAGKTSVIKLLTRLYDVGRGRILLDGVDLRELSQEALRRRVALVQQDVFLFSGTVADNIGLMRPDIDAAAIEAAARAVEAHGFISALPHGFQTHLHERGANLSGGQRQLLSFARALAHGADVLVLDEATSSIDTETEALIQQALRVLWQGKTAIVIAHRLSTIQDVDRIHVLHHGRIVESGRHEDLLARRGVYYRLYRLQYEGQRSAGGSPAGAGKG